MNKLESSCLGISKGTELVDLVNQTMLNMTQEVDVDDKEVWELAALRVWEVFCLHADRPLSVDNFAWIKKTALDDLCHDYELGHHIECPKICGLVEAIFDDIGEKNSWSKEINDITQQIAAISITSAQGEEKVSHPRSTQSFIRRFLDAASHEIDEDLLKELTQFCSMGDLANDMLLTRQTFDWIKEEILNHVKNDKIEEILNQTFAEIKWQNTLNRDDAEDFLKLYRDFVIANDSDGPESCFLKNDLWITDDTHVFKLDIPYYNEFDYRNLEVTLPMQQIRQIYETERVIQLRPIDPSATTLIIGCGNGRLSCAGGSSYGFNAEKTPWSKEPWKVYARKHSVEHLHPGVITIDPQLAANPTLVAYFGDQPVSKIFKGQKFDTIIFEGYYSDYPQKFRKSDLIELLSENGRLYIDYCAGPVPLEQWRIGTL